MRRNSGKKPQPPRHGVIRVATMKPAHAKAHLQMISESASQVRDYGGHQAIGCHSEGAFAPGGAAGADYQTTSVNDTPNTDWSGELVSKTVAVMLLVYGDESMDETKQRVCAVAGVGGTEEQWSALEWRLTRRTNGLPFHANDCDSDQGDYTNRPHWENKNLYRDLTIMLANSGLFGFG